MNCWIYIWSTILILPFYFPRRIINKHTDESLGDCSFLNTCFHMDTCKYVHYEIDACMDSEAPGSKDHTPSQELALTQSVGGDSSADRLFPPQVPVCSENSSQLMDLCLIGQPYTLRKQSIIQQSSLAYWEWRGIDKLLRE